MIKLKSLIYRNTKLFFKDKTMFLVSLITPLILLVLYSTFLGNTYRNSLMEFIPDDIDISQKVCDGFVAGQLFSSILSVSCVTVAFCSNMLMVQDKANNTIKDLIITPVKPSILSLGYYIASFLSTMLIALIATLICFVYIATSGWLISSTELVLLFFDILLLVLFGTALSSIINFFLNTEGQMSAVGTIVSSSYGFICGAYMPISQFSIGLQRVISFFPGIYGTSLVRSHALGGVMRQLENEGIPTEVVNEIKRFVDFNIYFFDIQVGNTYKFFIMIMSVIFLIGVYILMNYLHSKKNRLKK